MGAYINYRLAEPSQAQKANDWLEDQSETSELKPLEFGQPIHFWDEVDIRIEETKDTGVPDFHEVGEGQLKVSCLQVGEEGAHIKSLWVSLFEKLHAHEQFDVEVLSDSCGLNNHYFTPEQLASITDDGNALTGGAVEEFQRILSEAN
ncbi:hypothetical protein [Haloarcula sp. Atlit-7R]|uniref:hypothetical protein n=1 Tax=Haloarcula sp. Atlit-7R TaxID=2282125 RepID=UPI000EF13704|nr:hypothetical protein [Haloarcula sp. Atlit-7R]RLM94286.1 hypothetical protein D3D01_15595 [Haloarcula sp. Atlit-7R]